MAHFAEVDNNNTVLRVLVVDNSLEHRGADFLSNDLGLGGTWIQTSYNNKIKGNFAGIGFTYLPLEDIFMPVKCHAEAILNVKSAKWDCENAEHEALAE
jgi:hypothetical protein